MTEDIIWNLCYDHLNIDSWREDNSMIEVYILSHRIIIDAQDRDILLSHKWNILTNRSNSHEVFTYINIQGKKSIVNLHRLILAKMLRKQLRDIKISIHIDGDWRNNRRFNLKEGSSSDAAHRRRTQSNNTSGIKGVSFWKHDKAWVVQFSDQGRKKYKRFPLAKYANSDTAKKAAIKYRKQLEKDHGITLSS